MRRLLRSVLGMVAALAAGLSSRCRLSEQADPLDH